MRGKSEGKVFLSKDIVDNLRKIGLSWCKICKDLNISRQTLSRWRTENDYIDPRPILTGEVLDTFILRTSQLYRNGGRVMMIAAVREAGYRGSEAEIRESMHRVDPDGCQARLDIKGFRIPRRVYNVTRPHALWHIDSNHKLVFWNLSVVGGIDGFSRFCPFLSCSDNNSSSTMLSEFLIGIDRCGIPSRIRIDKGGENVDIVRYMLRKRGPRRHTVISGKSTGSKLIYLFMQKIY